MMNETNTTPVFPRNPLPMSGRPVCLEEPQKYMSEVVILGYISPVLVPFIVALNTTMIWIFWTRKFRSPTHVIMTGMALADMLNAISILPWTIHFFTLGNSKDCVPESWCLSYFILRHIVPQIFHNASIWLNVFLALERLIVVTFPMRAKTICSMRNAVIVVFIAFIFSVPLLSYRIIITEFSSTSVKSNMYENKTFEACVTRTTNDSSLNISMHVIVQIMPPILLAVLNILLVFQLRRVVAKRKGTFKHNIGGDAMENRTLFLTRTVVYVIFAILFTELPITVTILMAINGGFRSCKQCPRQIFTYFHLLILIMYPSNFVVYNLCSQEFRESVKKLLKCRITKESDMLAINGRKFVSNEKIDLVSIKTLTSVIE